jgi:hypothetical protein
MAYHRLMRLQQQLEKDSKYKEDYVAFMAKIIDKGHAELVPEEELDQRMAKFGIFHIMVSTMPTNLGKLELFLIVHRNLKESL